VSTLFKYSNFNELSEQYRFLKESFIINCRDGLKVIYTTINNCFSVLDKKDYYIYLNYSNLIRYFLFEFFVKYKGDDVHINEIVRLLKTEKRNKKLNILKFIIEDEFLYKNIIKKYYPEKDVFNLESRNLNLLNHIFFHKEKIFNEENIIKLIKRAIKNVTISAEINIIEKLNSGIINGFKAKEPTIQDNNYGIDFWFVNTQNNSKFPIKFINIPERSEFNIVNHNGIHKIIIDDIKSNINNYKNGVNAMRYNYILLFHNNTLTFINTNPIEEINNRKNDKCVSLIFDCQKVKNSDDIKKYIKKYTI
jgi:hypothetical protein